MNAKKFDLELQKGIHLGIIDENFIKKLFQSEKVRFLNNVPIDVLIKRNYETILQNCLPGHLVNSVRVMYGYEKMQDFILDNYDILLRNIKDKCDVFDLLERGFSGLSCKKYINNHLDYLLNTCSPNFIFSILVSEDMEEIPLYNNCFFEKQNFDQLNFFLRKNKKKYLEFLLCRFCSKEMNVDGLYDLIVGVVDEILDCENLDYMDIQLLHGGSYSDVLKIGNKVLKLGRSRISYQIPFDKVILQPIIRVDLSKISDLPLVLEVMENVSTDIHLSDEELYQFYVELRDRGIIFADIKNDNLGILLKDNQVHWNKAISLENENRGIEGSPSSILKSGSVVILDTDYLYAEKDYYDAVLKGSFTWGNYKSRDFESRYQLEQEQKKISFPKR